MSNKLIITHIIYFVLLLVLVIINYSDISIVIIVEKLKLNINHPTVFQSFILRVSLYLLIFGSFVYGLILLKAGDRLSAITSFIHTASEKTANLIELRYYVPVVIIYLVILIFTAINNYDLGFDEAWYLNYAANIKLTGFPFYNINEKIGMISIIDMLPNYLTYFVYDQLFHVTLKGTKIISTFLSLAGLFLIFYSIRGSNSKAISLLTMTFIVLQPGFGFVATSFFGEIIAIGILFYGAHLLFNQNRYISASILFSLAAHTKFQLFGIILLVLLCSLIFWKEKRILYSLVAFILFAGLIIILRTVPVILHDPGLLLNIVKQFYNLSSYHSSSESLVYFDRLQLYNRFFPLAGFAIISFISYPIIKTKYEKFILCLMILMNLYWIFFFNFVTYRHLFMGIIPLCYLTALLLFKYYDYVVSKMKTKKVVFKYLLGFSLFIFSAYGISTNLIYAYIGYNDGVQFDLDGYQSRLFNDITQDNTQKEFYNKVISVISENDVIYSESPHLSKFYLTNKVYSLNSYKITDKNRVSKFIIISRESFPGKLQEGFHYINKLKISYEEVIKVGEFYLLKIV